jgi:hypothetical protein
MLAGGQPARLNSVKFSFPLLPIFAPIYQSCGISSAGYCSQFKSILHFNYENIFVDENFTTLILK